MQSKQHVLVAGIHERERRNRNSDKRIDPNTRSSSTLTTLHPPTKPVKGVHLHCRIAVHLSPDRWAGMGGGRITGERGLCRIAMHSLGVRRDVRCIKSEFSIGGNCPNLLPSCLRDRKRLLTVAVRPLGTEVDGRPAVSRLLKFLSVIDEERWTSASGVSGRRANVALGRRKACLGLPSTKSISRYPPSVSMDHSTPRIDISSGIVDIAPPPSKAFEPNPESSINRMLVHSVIPEKILSSLNRISRRLDSPASPLRILDGMDRVVDCMRPIHPSAFVTKDSGGQPQDASVRKSHTVPFTSPRQ
ncbi:hypothetical protein KC336_g82 [Hortaea werneckii]|nr:hypothetical protein KC336_g82 [Hortaea werneckii]